MEKVSAVRMSCLSISPSPFSCVTRLPCCFSTTSSTPRSSPFRSQTSCRANPDPKARVQRTSAPLRRTLTSWPTAHTTQLLRKAQAKRSQDCCSVSDSYIQKTRNRIRKDLVVNKSTLPSEKVPLPLNSLARQVTQVSREHLVSTDWQVKSRLGDCIHKISNMR